MVALEICSGALVESRTTTLGSVAPTHGLDALVGLVMWMLKVNPDASLPKVQDSFCGLPEIPQVSVPLPPVKVSVAMDQVTPEPLGNVSLSVAPSSTPGPLLPPVMVNPMLSPALTVALSASF